MDKTIKVTIAGMVSEAEPGDLGGSVMFRGHPRIIDDAHPRLDDAHPRLTDSLVIRTEGENPMAVEIRVGEDGSILLRAAK